VITRENIVAALKTVMEPELHKDIVSLGMLKDFQIDGNKVAMEITLTTPACPLKDKISEDIKLALRGHIPEVGNIDIKFGADVRGSRPIEGNRLATVKNVIAVGSGKGGVGKSTVAVNLALALQQEGAKTGLLDADIYGPSIPIMCGVKEGEKPSIAAGNRIIPLKRFNMPLMSMGFLMGSNDAVIWRGPMLAKMLQQFLEQVEWGELDYLVVDLPPGTGDVQISLSQLIPISGAVVVTTPQDVALADVKRAIKMFQMTQVPILGIVENMSGFECGHCHQATPIFGGGDKEKYQKLGLDLLGTLPLELDTRVAGDQGEPITVRSPKSKQAELFRALARQIAAHQSVQNFSKELELPSLQ
jgi:ATP-binding protein involved in chromosome partitioning